MKAICAGETCNVLKESHELENMQEQIQELIEGLKTTAGATETSLADLQSALGYSLPEQYLEFLRFSNGAEGSMGEGSYLVIWPVEELVSLNEMNAVRDAAPELLLFGSDSGTRGYAFDTTAPGMPIIQIDLILIDVKAPVASCLFEFLEKLATQQVT